VRIAVDQHFGGVDAFRCPLFLNLFLSHVVWHHLGDPMNVSKSEPLVPSAFARQIDHDDGAALLDVKQGVCFSINSVGLEIWSLLKEKHSPTQIAALLVAEYGIEQTQASEDVTEFIESLRAHHLLIAEGERPSGRFHRIIVLAQRLRGFRRS
jgi:hypothetical protein